MADRRWTGWVLAGCSLDRAIVEKSPTGFDRRGRSSRNWVRQERRRESSTVEVFIVPGLEALLRTRSACSLPSFLRLPLWTAAGEPKHVCSIYASIRKAAVLSYWN